MVIYRDGIRKNITNQINKSNLFCYGSWVLPKHWFKPVDFMKVEDRGTPFIEKINHYGVELYNFLLSGGLMFFFYGFSIGGK